MASHALRSSVSRLPLTRASGYATSGPLPMAAMPIISRHCHSWQWNHSAGIKSEHQQSRGFRLSTRFHREPQPVSREGTGAKAGSHSRASAKASSMTTDQKSQDGTDELTIRNWNYSQILGTMRRLVDPELHAHVIDGETVAIVDAREPHEYAEGHIPAAINLPLSILEKADEEVRQGLVPASSASEFKHKILEHIGTKHSAQFKDIKAGLFANINPGANQFVEEIDVVVYCRAGVRSKKAAEILARRLGGDEIKPRLVVGNYAGSWDDWIEKGGEVEKTNPALESTQTA